MKTKKTIYWIMFLLVSYTSFGQESTYSKTYQFSFVPPISSNGALNSETSNKISFNLLAGYSHDVEAFEYGGIYNHVRANVKGAQISGFGNTVGGEVHGFQMAGFFNNNGGEVEGAQVAGFINLSRNNVKGFQLAGFTNISGDIDGWQLSGFSNIAGATEGVQLAGFHNLAKETIGWQLAGFHNHSKEIKGNQLAGFMNYTGTLDGVQLAGFVNVAKKVKGVQFGLINVADSVESGVQFGLVNVSKNGLISIGTETDDVVPYRLVFRSGQDWFYTVLSAGIKENEYWSFGAGFGSQLFLSEKRNLFVNPELRYHQINKDQSVAKNHLVKMNLNLGYQLSNHFYITAGPTFNFYTTKEFDQNGRPLLDIVDDPTHESQDGKSRYQQWVGYSIGIGFNL
ncbi:MAG: hypothetical protein GY816_14270 [Cytophagales bacterium]|nr:hypothetical protein [Cytophagales bacterium]